MNTKEFIQEALKLRREADNAEGRFLEFLYQGEQQPEIWEGVGLDFASWIERENLCKASRYLAYKRVRESHGDSVIGVGVHAAIAAAKVPGKKYQAEVLSESRLWEETNGTSISAQSANRIAKDVKVRVASARSKHKSYAEIVAENEKLREENEALKHKISLLQDELKNKTTKTTKATKATNAA